MMKWLESTGRNEDEAIAKALAQLGLERDDVSVEVLERAKSGFLGIGSSPAKVKVSYEGPDDEPLPEPTPPPRREAPSHPEPVRRQEPPKRQDPVRTTTPKEKEPAVPVVAPTAKPAPVAKAASAATPTQDEVSARIQNFLGGLLPKMGMNAQVQVAISEEGNYKVTLLGEGLGAIIGRRGETLDAVQQLTGYAVNRGQSKRVRIHVDAENYRQKREESLCRLAEKVAERVLKYRRNVTLEPMNAYERHVIHAALQDYSNISTYSTGTEPNRRTVVAYQRGGV